jgi:hypothetical protein
MENINVADILKKCPTGMRLVCSMYEDVYFDYVDELNVIHCYIQYETHKTSITFNQYGTPNSNIKSKCVIFPIGNPTWEGFVQPVSIVSKFKDGDIVTNIEGDVIIYKEVSPSGYCDSFASLDHNNQFIPRYKAYLTDTIRLSTDEEIEKLLNAVKENGYKWNAETKTLEKLIVPKFKVGDRIKYRHGEIIYRIVKITEDKYILNNLHTIPISIEFMYNLVPNKFDISTLIPFESKVLVRNTEEDIWKPAIFGCYANKTSHYYVLGGTCWSYCIPYEGNEHLRGKIEDCDKRYKTWEK